MSMPAGASAYALAFEFSPITLTGGGVASGIPGGNLPLLSLLQSLSFVGGLLQGSNVGLTDMFADFFPLPGTSMIDNQIGNYPFANMSVAANALIEQPLVVSLLMRCPVNQPGGYLTKAAIMTAMQATLKQHNRSGGTYTVATPSLFYPNCLLIGLHDVSSGDTLQAQSAWRFDFVKPLVTLQEAYETQNASMSRITSGVATNGALSGIGNTVGAPSTLATPGISPAAGATPGSGIQARGGVAA